MQKVGIGYDIHRLVEGRPLIIGGVEIAYEKGLDGHSDADVLLHAVCDALLGAMGNGDIGEHFPDDDPQYKDISSLLLLKEVASMVHNKGYKVGNLDCVVQAEAPKLKDFKKQMELNMAIPLNCSEERINVKATTMEQLGPIGTNEAIAAFANVLLIQK